MKSKAKKLPRELPNKLSELLLIAVEDARAIAKMPGYKLDMGEWHHPNGVCKVCMAGAVMVNRLRVNRRDEAMPSNFEPSTRDKLLAINDLRIGAVESASWWLKAHVPPTIAVRASEAIAYQWEADGKRDGGRAPWRNYIRAARILAEAGL